MLGGSGGIGAAICRALAVRGASLVVHGGASRDRLERTLAGLASALAPGATAEGFLLEADLPSTFVEKAASFGPFDIAVISFGPFFRGSLSQTSAREWERLALLDLALPGALCSALLPGMMDRGYGRFLLLGGTRTDAVRAYSSNAAYAAAKTGLAVLAKSLAVEGAGRGVACVLACPGLVDTEYLDENARSALRAKAPRGRLYMPEEIARPAVELIAADPCTASGAVVSLDGGLDLQ
ncbi:MAG: SDR family oxidoreductase [Spirochaetaceae bacterium]|nr:SDR family oxidoreductase [Spirochaetaceae bacterium]